MIKKAAALLFAALILLSSVAGCADKAGDDSANNSSVTESVETTEEELSDGLPELNFEGHNFRMLVRNSAEAVLDVWSEEQTGDLMEDAIFNRNFKIGERFNVTFEAMRSSSDNYDTDALKSILGGDDAYDLICPHARASFIYATEHSLLNWNIDLPYVNLDQPWWAQDARENLSVAGQLYTMTGDISHINFGMSTCLVFNKALFADLGIEAPYSLVLDNKWTFDKFNETIKNGYKDLNGDSKESMKEDQFGYMTAWWSGPIQVLYSANERTAKKDEDDIPYLSINSERVIDLFDKYFSIFNNSYAYLVLSDSNSDSEVAFKASHLLMRDVVFKDIAVMRDMEVDFGIVPWPKLDETVDKYYCNVNAFSPLFCVPITANDPSRTSVILEALAFESYRTVIPTYYEVALKTKFARDDDSADMLDIIKDGRLYDFGYYTDAVGIFSSTGRVLAEMPARNFASFYSQNERTANKTLEKFIKKFTE